MIKQLSFENWKSIRDSVIYIDPLSFLIGTNASGKSNVLDALDFLQRLSFGQSVTECVKNTRGGVDWLILDGEKETTLTVVVSESNVDYTYRISLVKTSSGIVISKESLKRQKTSIEKVLFDTETTLPNGAIITRFYTAKPGRSRRLDLFANTSILNQAENLSLAKEVKQPVSIVLSNLRSIFILTPLPEKMRQYVPLDTELDRNGGNVAGLIAGMDDDRKLSLETKLQQYLHDLPERDVEKVWAEKIGKFGTDAMLYCEEKWTDDKVLSLDARGMSDGTLRFIAMILALLTRPEHSLLVIEEIDNGLHPSRTDELINMLRSLGNERSIDILCTTHNPVLIDRLGNDMIPFITVVKRSLTDGSSELKLLEDKADLLEMVSSGTVGQGMVEDRL